MFALKFCTIFNFHCIEVVRSREWDILTFSVDMASEILNPCHGREICAFSYKSTKIFDQHSNEQSQGSPNTRAAGKYWIWINCFAFEDAYNNQKNKIHGKSGYLWIICNVFSCVSMFCKISIHFKSEKKSVQNQHIQLWFVCVYMYTYTYIYK